VIDAMKKWEKLPTENMPTRIALRLLYVNGFHMTVNGKHVTSFVYHESLEPWSVTGVIFTGDLNLLSVLVSGFPTS
jgi:beta-1,3-galactosyltransferase